MLQRRMPGSTLSKYKSRNMDSTRISRSHLQSRVRKYIFHPTVTFTSDCLPLQLLNFALYLCLHLRGLFIGSESSDRRESSILARPGLCSTGEQTNPALHVPWSPSSTYPMALASLPVQRPVSSSEDAKTAVQCAH